MSDTYKEKQTITARTRNTVHKTLAYDPEGSSYVLSSAEHSEPDLWPTISKYKTTERNVKKNGGKGPKNFGRMCYSPRLVPSKQTRKVREYSAREKKFIEKEVPIITQRLVRSNPPNPPPGVGGSNFKINDMSRSITQVFPGEVQLLRQSPGMQLEYRHVWEGDLISVGSQLGTEFFPSYVLDTLVHEDLVSRYSAQIAIEDATCLQNLYAKIRNQPADLGTDLAEGRKTIQSFAELSKRFAEFALHMKKLKFTKALDTLLPLTKKKLANDFLAYRYGISPLISDIKGMTDDIIAHLEDVYKWEASARKKRILTSTFEIAGGSGYCDSVVEITVKYKVFYGVDDTILNTLNRLGLTNPTAVAWELVPFSFVVDWFLPIGKFIGSLGSINHLTIKSVHRTVVVKETLNTSYSTPPSYEYPLYLAAAAWTWPTVQNFVMTRTVLPSLPPCPAPRFKNPISLGHILNATALLTQMFSKRS